MFVLCGFVLGWFWLVRSVLPRHVGVIPDGNRRWAVARGLRKEVGYAAGVEAGLLFFDLYKNIGIEEVSVYGFTKDNTKRSSEQMIAFRKAVVDFAFEVYRRGAALLVVGDVESDLFPLELKRFCSRQGDGVGIPIENKSFLYTEGFSTAKSTGLGLPLTKKIVEFYGWTLTEQGTPGNGAKFIITIPTKQP
jgi:hypothetical protein